MVNILIADDQPYIRTLLSKELEKEGFLISSLGCVEIIWDRIKTSRPDLILLGLHPDSYDCWGILKDAKRKFPDLPILIYVIRSFKDINCLKQAIGEVLNNKESPAMRDKLGQSKIQHYGRGQALICP